MVSTRSIFAMFLSAIYTALAVDLPHWSTRLCRPKVLSPSILLAVGVQLHRTGDTQLHQICFSFADRG